MPEDIEPISDEALFSQRFLQQLSADQAAGTDPAAATGSTAVGQTGQPVSPLAAVLAGKPLVEPEAGSESAPVDADTAATPADQEVTVAGAAPANPPVKTEEAKAAKPAIDPALMARDGLLPEDPDAVPPTPSFAEQPFFEWKAVTELRREHEEIDDGRKDGTDGAEGEMIDETEEEEFKILTDKEFQAQLLSQQMPTLMKFFRPELLNRFDEIIFFSPLRKKELVQIVDVMLRETREMLTEKNLQLKLSDAARDFIADKGYNPAFGARPLRRAIQEYLEDPLSDLLIMGKFKSGDTIYADRVGPKLEFTKDVGSGKVEDMFETLDEAVTKDEQGNPQPAAKPGEEEIGVKDPFAEIYGDDLSGKPAATAEQEQSQATNALAQGTPAAPASPAGNAPAATTPPATSPFAEAQQTATAPVASGVSAAAPVADSEPKKHSLFGKMFSK